MAWGRAFAFLAAMACHAAANVQPVLKSLPFTKIADEIYAAERNARELSWKVSNSTLEKSSMQWFMASAMKELTDLTKVVLNTTSEGSLGYEYQACLNKTEAHFPKYNTTISLEKAIKKDKTLAAKLVEAEMYQLYENQVKAEELTKEIGACAAKCPVSFLATHRAAAVRAHHVSADPPSPQVMMRSIADAIYNTSKSIDTMQEHLTKDAAAKDVLKALTSTVMSKLLSAKKDVEEMHVKLKVCQRTPEATHVIDQTKEVMALNPEVSADLVKSAEERTKGSKDEVTGLVEKLETCRKKCDVWYHYKPEFTEDAGESE